MSNVMAKVLLLSILMACIIIPYSAARDAQPERALRKVIGRFLVFVVGYGFCLRFLYWRLL